VPRRLEPAVSRQIHVHREDIPERRGREAVDRRIERELMYGRVGERVASRAAARRTWSSERSMPTNSARGHRAAKSSRSWPLPQPTSRTRSAVRGGRSVLNHCTRKGASGMNGTQRAHRDCVAGASRGGVTLPGALTVNPASPPGLKPTNDVGGPVQPNQTKGGSASDDA
jgi:hypothetical protein